MRRFALFYIAPVVLLLLAVLMPLILGQETLYARDVLHSHYPLKAAQAQLMQQGELPLIDPFRAGGQPLVGNLNALPLYPSNVLYLVGSPLWALNAHFWIHWLLAPFAFLWLGRALGLDRRAAWAGGVLYATSGFFLSQLNLYNLVAGAALVPAMIAACLEAWQGRQRGLFAAGLLWTLLILAGDPLFGALGLGLGLAACVLLRGPRPAQPVKLAGVLACGTLLAAPQIVETLRILGLSYRGYWQYSPQAALAQSLNPRTAIEGLLPLFFGRPDYSFWGRRFFGGNEPLFFSLYPGWLALALAVGAGRSREKRHLFAWSLVLLGIFFATGAYNPLVRALYHLPGASMLRYPVKFSLLIAVGLALLASLGFERLLRGEARRAVAAVLGIGLALCGLFWLTASAASGPFLAAMRQLDPQRLTDGVLQAEHLRWAGVAFLSALTLALMLGALRLGRHRAQLAGAALLLLHASSQLFFLQPLYDSDLTEPYRTPPPLLAEIPADSLVVHGGFNSLFGRRQGDLSALPDLRTFWLSRRFFAEMYPFSGVQWGRHYAFNPSPEGLDTFFQIALSRRLPELEDRARLAILSASGVDFLLLDRPLAESVSDRVELQRVIEGPVGDLRLYRLLEQAAPAQLAGTVLAAPHLNAALEQLTREGFDSRTMAVVPGNGPDRQGPPGTVDILQDDLERMRFRVASASGGVLTLRRAYLDLYRASIDGEPAPTTVVNVHRLGVEVPPGTHEVEVWIDRRPTRVAHALAVLGLLGLILIIRRSAKDPLTAAPSTADLSTADLPKEDPAKAEA